MPHKVTTISLVDELTTTAQIAGAANAILKRSDGSLLGDMFDGTGFTRGLKRKRLSFAGAKCLVIGTGGVGSAIAASLALKGLPEYPCMTPTRHRLKDWLPPEEVLSGARSQNHR